MGIEHHRLQPLLAPRSIAVIGASPRADTAGHDVIRQLSAFGFPGRIHPINPRYEAIEGLRCVGAVSELDAPPDLAVIAVANARVEEQLKAAIEAGARAACIFGSCYLPEDTQPPLTRRLAAMAREARMPICGANCIGLYNYESRLASSWFPSPAAASGSIAFISHSGGVFCAYVGGDFRLRFNIAVSAGQELSTTVADYLDYALEMDSTRVVALFLETVRDPAGFAAALEKARTKDVPVLAVKIGRTTLSARLAESHSGAIAGDDAAYGALFDKYGVVRCRTSDELAASAQFLANGRRPAAGGLAAIMDSGGGRGLMIDLAADIGLPLAKIGEATRATLAANLAYGLEAVNPLDAWGAYEDFESAFRNCLAALMADPDTGAGLFLYDMWLEDYISEGFTRALLEVARTTDKPVAAVSNIARLPRDKLARALDAAGIPVIDGMEHGLSAVRNAFAVRAAREAGHHPDPPPAPPAEASRARWRTRLAHGTALTDSEAFALLADYGVPVAAIAEARNSTDALAAARALGYPVALKTAGADHKTEMDGVKLGLADEAALGAAYEDFARRLGPAVTLSPMAKPGVEMALGVVVDPQFGPLVLVAAGGVLIEVMRDARFVLAPCGPRAARRAIDRLTVRSVLDGVRGKEAADLGALADAVARLSVLAADLAPHLATLDVNPIICRTDGALAVDALVKPKTP